jgi:hypothetical protein
MCVVLLNSATQAQILVKRSIDFNTSLEVEFYVTTWSRILLDQITVTQLVKKYLLFMEPEASLLFSQQPVAGPYSKPHVSNPQFANLFPKIKISTIKCYITKIYR